MTLISQSWFWLVSVTTAVLAFSIFTALRPRLRETPRWVKGLLLTALVASAALLLRPHEDTFTGLDTSCYRLMSQAFTAGRGFHNIDQTLLVIPPEQRRSVLLEFQQWGRDTRDRSFEITSISNGTTQPYFYPFLPLAASALETLTDESGGDYFAPLVGLLFFASILALGATRGRQYGLLAAIALLVGTPLPAYLFRGFYAEAVGAALVSLVLIGRALPVTTRSFRITAPLLLGLATCFHPATLVLSLPALAFLLADPARTRRSILLNLGGFSAGLLPILFATLWVCHPYGDITKVKSLLNGLSASGVHRLLAIFISGFGLAIALILFGSVRLRERLAAWGAACLARPGIYVILLSAALLPFLIPAALWPGKPLVWAGLQEWRDGVRWGYGIVLLIGVASTFHPKTPPLSRALLILTLLLSCFFFYLKGFEQMGLWSQRRLIPLTCLLVVTLTPALATFFQSLQERTPSSPKWLPPVLAVILAGAALVNPLRWPDPYLTRHEKGAREWVAAVSKKLGSTFTFFDYYPFSVPFAATGHSRVFGLSEYGYTGLPGLAEFLGHHARQEPVLYVTAYENPGMEEGVILKERSRETVALKRVVSKTALPAERRRWDVSIAILEAIPVSSLKDTRNPPLAVDKILDDGPLALRGNWGPRNPIPTRDKILSARWSREGSGLIGPVPAPGGSIRITLAAAASRDDGISGQVFQITPPWSGPILTLTVGNDLTRVSGELTRPSSGKDGVAETGVYTLHAESPYNPAKVGISGYPSDLGARIHSIRIELL